MNIQILNFFFIPVAVSAVQLLVALLSMMRTVPSGIALIVPGLRLSPLPPTLITRCFEPGLSTNELNNLEENLSAFCLIVVGGSHGSRRIQRSTAEDKQNVRCVPRVYWAQTCAYYWYFFVGHSRQRAGCSASGVQA